VAERAIVFASGQGDVENEPKVVQISRVTGNSFIVSLSGDYKASDKINWLAVLPGKWETPNGMQLTAGRNLQTTPKVSLHKISTSVFNMPNAKEPGWIAIENGKTEMWSGRFCSAQQLETQDQNEIEYQLQRYFYDKTITLVDATNKALHPIVIRTTNTGGKVKCQSGQMNPMQTLNICCFDGSGGCLYGSAYKNNK